MSPGTCVPARRREARRHSTVDRRSILGNGAFTFAERPEVEAPDARIIWRADIDPSTLEACAHPVDKRDRDAVDAQMLSPWLTSVRDAAGEHVVLSDGWRRIRIDITGGSLSAGGPVVLRYRLQGHASAQPKLLPLRRLVDLCRHRRFSVSLYPRDRRIDRWVALLRTRDAVADGASQRDILRVFFDEEATPGLENGRTRSLQSRVRRLVAEAGRLAGGGYRTLLSLRD